VFGVVVAKLIDDKLRYAASVIPNVSLLEYEVEFHLKRGQHRSNTMSRHASMMPWASR
jgi:hypothetical protein